MEAGTGLLGSGAQQLGAVAQAFGLESTELDGWILAQNLSKIQFEGASPRLKGLARRIASAAILRRALDLIGPMRPAKRRISEVLDQPFLGELDVEQTIENLTGKEFPDTEDWIISRRQERRIRIVLMMDTSLSMSGKNLALAAVATAVLAMKVASKDLALVAFESTATALTYFDAVEPVDKTVDSILKRPARGFTNLEAGLREGRRQLSAVSAVNTATLLITDGVYTAGGDPTSEAARFQKLLVMLTQDYNMCEELCHRMARAGNGQVIGVKGYADLPRKMLEVVNIILR